MGCSPASGIEIKQREPQHDVEHKGGTDGLGGHGETCVGPFDAVGREQAVPDTGTSGGPARDHVGDGRRCQDDPDQLEEPGASTGQQRAGEEGVTHDRARLECDPGDEPPDVELAEQMQVLARTHELGDDEVFDDEQDQEDEQAVAQPLRDDRTPRAGRGRLGPVVGVHPPMFPARGGRDDAYRRSRPAPARALGRGASSGGGERLSCRLRRGPRACSFGHVTWSVVRRDLRSWERWNRIHPDPVSGSLSERSSNVSSRSRRPPIDCSLMPGSDRFPTKMTTDHLEDAAIVLVSGDPAAGFACVGIVDGSAHLWQLSVHPSESRRGRGTALVAAVCDWAASNGYRGVTLTTFRDVPWNGPFYRGLGFHPLDDPLPELAAIRDRETMIGLDDLGARIAMQKDL